MAKENVMTVGMRSDGFVSVISAPGDPGPQPLNAFLMNRETAKWVADEIYRALDSSPPNATPGNGKAEDGT